MGHHTRKLVFQPSIFRCYVRFGGCMYVHHKKCPLCLKHLVIIITPPLPAGDRQNLAPPKICKDHHNISKNQNKSMVIFHPSSTATSQDVFLQHHRPGLKIWKRSCWRNVKNTRTPEFHCVKSDHMRAKQQLPQLHWCFLGGYFVWGCFL